MKTKAAGRKKYTHMIGVYVTQKTFAAVSRAARKERRTISHVVREILDEAWVNLPQIKTTPAGQKGRK